MSNPTWDLVKEFYKEKFGIDAWVVEVYANMDILLLCSCGSCNKTITTFLEIPLDEVSQVIKTTFDFDGWEKDLRINPYSIYCYMMNMGYPTLDDFKKEVSLLLNGDLDRKELDLDKLYSMCQTMYDIESKIRDEWK